MFNLIGGRQYLLTQRQVKSEEGGSDRTRCYDSSGKTERTKKFTVVVLSEHLKSIRLCLDPRAYFYTILHWCEWAFAWMDKQLSITLSRADFFVSGLGVIFLNFGTYKQVSQ